MGDFIDKYIHWNRFHGSPELYHRWSALYVLSSIVGRKIWLGNKNRNPLFANLYVSLVGPPALLFKSTCVRIARGIAAKVLEQKHFLPHAGSKEAIAIRLKGLQQPEPRLVCLDTPVKVGPHGVFYVAEMATLCGPANKRDDGIINWFLDWFDSLTDDEPWEYLTVGRFDNPECLYQTYVSLYFATTPIYLRRRFPDGCTEEGFNSRVVWLYQTAKDIRPSPFGDDCWDDDEAEELVVYLKEIDRIINGWPLDKGGQFKLTKDATILYDDWYKDWLKKTITEQHSGIAGFLGREPVIVKKLCLLKVVSDLDRIQARKIEAKDIEWAVCEIAKVENYTKNLFGAAHQDPLTETMYDMFNELARSRIQFYPNGMDRAQCSAQGMINTHFRHKFREKVGERVMSEAALKIIDEGWATITPPVEIDGEDKKKAVIVLLEEGVAK